MPTAALAAPTARETATICGPAGGLGEGLGHERRGTLVARGHDADAGLGQVVEQGQDGLRRHREAEAGAGRLQLASDLLRDRAAHGLRRWRRLGWRCGRRLGRLATVPTVPGPRPRRAAQTASGSDRVGGVAGAGSADASGAASGSVAARGARTVRTGGLRRGRRARAPARAQAAARGGSGAGCGSGAGSGSGADAGPDVPSMGSLGAASGAMVWSC